MAAGVQLVEGRFPAQFMYTVAVLYYLEDATQAEIAARLNTSRATVSRALSEARRQGIVHIEVTHPGPHVDSDLAEQVAAALGIEAVHLFPDTAPEVLGSAVGPALSEALGAADLSSGDVVLVSSGKSLWTASRTDLLPLPGVLVAPTVGGNLEPEPWYQTNEITRQFASRIGGQPAFLHAPALPGAALHESLMQDPAITRIFDMWSRARCAVLGVGAPLTTGRSIPAFVPRDAAVLSEAVGDICSRFYDRHGEPVAFPGSERLVATTLERLREIPVGIAVAYGEEKVISIRAGARGRLFNRLVTDVSTAGRLAVPGD
jgi:DNA-binding transcriptional regulator LsrR (DeoR family)